MNKLWLPLILLTGIVACTESETNQITANDGKVVSGASSSSDLSDKELEKQQQKEKEEEERRLAEIKANQTTLRFDRKIHDFGTTKVGIENVTEFIVYNTGSKPLIIDDVSASCGCTTPKKPEGPIAPGESDVIQVKFKAKPSQLNEIEKSVAVTANTDPGVHKLQIKAFVKE